LSRVQSASRFQFSLRFAFSRFRFSCPDPSLCFSVGLFFPFVSVSVFFLGGGESVHTRICKDYEVMARRNLELREVNKRIYSELSKVSLLENHPATDHRDNGYTAQWICGEKAIDEIFL